jgi:DNA uptake protein ComE-like DNA-binding protein
MPDLFYVNATQKQLVFNVEVHAHGKDKCHNIKDWREKNGRYRNVKQL